MLAHEIIVVCTPRRSMTTLMNPTPLLYDSCHMCLNKLSTNVNIRSTWYHAMVCLSRNCKFCVFGSCRLWLDQSMQMIMRSGFGGSGLSSLTLPLPLPLGPSAFPFKSLSARLTPPPRVSSCLVASTIAQPVSRLRLFMFGNMPPVPPLLPSWELVFSTFISAKHDLQRQIRKSSMKCSAREGMAQES